MGLSEFREWINGEILNESIISSASKFIICIKISIDLLIDSVTMFRV